MSAFRRKLDKTRPHAVVFGSFHGAAWEQGGRYFDQEGDEIDIPGRRAVAEPPSPIDQARRLQDIMQADPSLSIVDAAAKVQAEVQAYEREMAEWKAGRTPVRERAPAPVPVRQPPPPPAAPEPVTDPQHPSNQPDEPAATAGKDIPLDAEGRRPWDWEWNAMLKHCADIGIKRPGNLPATQIALKEFYGVAR